MSLRFPIPAFASAEPGTSPQPRQGSKAYGLLVTVLVHLLVLVAVLTWRSRGPVPPKPHNIDVSLVSRKESPRIPEPAPLLPKPELQALSPPAIVEPPAIVVAEVQPAPQLVQPVMAAPLASPAPGMAAAPAALSPASAAAPAARAVGSSKLVEECADAPDRKMVAAVYRLSSRTTSVKEMNRLKPLRTVCLAQLNFAPRQMGLGLPGLDMSEWYGLDIRFTVNVPQDGSRDFVLLSDDGAMLYVDDVELVDNDGLHQPGAVMGTVNLSKGIHHLRVRYFQGPGDGALMLGWKKSGEADYQAIPSRLLGRPPTTTTAAVSE